MSFWGKTLIGLNIALSFTYLMFAGSVYNIQTNWRTETQKNREIIAQKDTELNDLNQRYSTLETDSTAQLRDLTDRAEKAEATLAQTQTALDTLTKRMETTQTELEREKALSQISDEEAQSRIAEALKARENNTALHKKIDEQMLKIHELEDQIYDQKIKEANLRSTHGLMLKEVAELRKIIRYQGLDKEDTKKILALQAPPPTVEGQVKDTQSNSRNGLEFVSVSVGSDDGLVSGHHLYVYRLATSPEDRPKYLGELEVVNVAPDAAVCLVLSKSKNGVIQKGDNVSSKL